MMDLLIISPIERRTVRITWLEVNTVIGNFVIQEGHAPTVLIAQQHKKIAFGLEGGDEETILMKQQGIVHITRNSVTLLINEHL